MNCRSLNRSTTAAFADPERLASRSRTLSSLVVLLLGLLVSSSCGPPPEPHATARLGAPHPEQSTVRMDIAFCLDSTGSMQGLIDEAKSRIREIDAELRSGDPAPSVRFGVVAYRDHGEDYVTLLYGLDPDVDQVTEALGEIEAEGGGDDPEHVVAGLRRAVSDLDWDPDATLRFLFLVGDAPPHLDYDGESDVSTVLAEAARKQIVIGSLVYGDSMSEEGHAFWRQVAGDESKLTEGVAGAGGGFESTLLMAIRREAAKQKRALEVAGETQTVANGELAAEASTSLEIDH